MFFFFLWYLSSDPYTHFYSQNVLDAIEKGKIVSSGAPQTSKDGPTGRNPVEFSQPRRIRPAGSREDMTFGAEESKDESGETRNYPDDKFRPEGMC
jgi:hypothetical protein